MCQILAVTSKQSVNNWRERSAESISRLPTPPVDFMWIWLRVNIFRADWTLTISISELIGTEFRVRSISCCNIEQVYWTLISHLCFSVDQTQRKLIVPAHKDSTSTVSSVKQVSGRRWSCGNMKFVVILGSTTEIILSMFSTSTCVDLRSLPSLPNSSDHQHVFTSFYNKWMNLDWTSFWCNKLFFSRTSSLYFNLHAAVWVIIAACGSLYLVISLGFVLFLSCHFFSLFIFLFL